MKAKLKANIEITQPWKPIDSYVTQITNMYIRLLGFLIAIIFIPVIPFCQSIEKVSYNPKDSTAGYYLAIRPQSNVIKGALVLLSSFIPPESLLPETKLHNVAYANDLLMIIASTQQKLYADSSSVDRINSILKDVVTRFAVDTSTFVLAGYTEAGNIALRYTELTYQNPSQYLIQPKAVFGIDTPVDLFGLWHWSERQVKKNYWPGSVGDAKYFLDVMTKENGTIYNNREKYIQLSPFNKQEETKAGNEQYLRNVAVRLYYDTDIEWQLKNRRNSFHDTNIPDGSELINRLLLSGNTKAEFITSRQPGLRSNGIRHPNSLSIVDEVECIQWIKKCLDIFDFNTWTPPYNLIIPKDWGIEHFPLPPDFAPGMTYKGVEDLRFAPRWGDSSSGDYWGYAYLWWLQGKPKVDAISLQQNVTEYYSGLVGRNIIERRIPANKVVPTVATIKQIKTTSGDIETYGGTISMLDYMTQKPIVLNTLIHVRNCGEQKNIVVFVKISPRPLVHPIWKQFGAILEEFKCDK